MSISDRSGTTPASSPREQSLSHPFGPFSGPGVDPASPEGAPRASRRRWWLVGGGVAVLAVVLLGLGSRRGDRPQYLSSAVQRGDIRDAVDATGTVNAVVTVLVGSQVSGTIARLNVDFNSRVHRGEVIAVIDPSLLQGTLLQATADLQNMRASVTGARANLAKANATATQTKAELDRVSRLWDSHMMTQSELDVARVNYATAHANVEAAQAGVEQAQAQVTQKEAAVAVARTNLDHTVIRSPIDGIVVARNVDIGQTVAASLQAPTIFTIAQDLTRMQVYAKIDESDVGRIRIGAPVTFKVDAFPKQQFTGVVSQVRMNPTTVQNVVTYDAIIDFQNPEMKLFPGMTAYVTVPVATATNVVKLPNAALRFTPPLASDEVRVLESRAGIDPADDGNGAGGAAAGSARATEQRNGAQGATAVVWKATSEGSVQPVEVALGITDHAYTEVTRVLHGTLKPGDDVVTTAVTSKGSAPGPQPIRR